jgi:diguanylate cyclase (GGDEF)-like protein
MARVDRDGRVRALRRLLPSGGLAALFGVSAAVVLIPLFAMAIAAVVRVEGHAADYERTAAEAGAEVELTMRALEELQRMDQSGLAAVRAGGNGGALLELTRRRFEASLVALTPALDELPERDALADARRRWRQVGFVLSQPVGPDTPERLRISMSSVQAALVGVLRKTTTELDRELAEVRELQERDLVLLLAQIPVGLLLAVLVIRRMLMKTVRPLSRIRHGAERLRAGELGHRVEGSDVAELDSLAVSFNTMAASLESSRAELRRSALHDALTGLPNRTLLDERGRNALTCVERRERGAALLFIDLDHFKQVNDRMGHAAGDRVLSEVGRRLADSLRDVDTVARLGGDEFAVLIDGPADEKRLAVEAAAVAERVIDLLSRPLRLSGRDVALSASVGIALASGSDLDRVLRDADAAMYRAKTRGLGAYEFHRPELGAAADDRLERIAELRGALDAGQLVVHYQPIIELASGRVVAAEALVRWSHPERGLIPPGDFIGLAEETGLVVPLGRAVLQTACGQLRVWDEAAPDRRPLTISVNLSPRQLLDPDLVADVRSALGTAGLDPGRLVLEITETAAVRDLEVAGARLEELRAIGVGIAMDDFGTGYSSLAYLRDLPLDRIKIARPFVQRIESSPADRALVRGIVEFGHALGLRVVAEGVEEDSQHACLIGLGCDLGQGFHYARPGPPEALTEHLRADRAPDAAVGAADPRRRP